MHSSSSLDPFEVDSDSSESDVYGILRSSDPSSFISLPQMDQSLPLDQNLSLFDPSDPENFSNSTSFNLGRDEDLAKFEIATLALIFVVTVVGNLVVLLGIFIRRQKMSRMYHFIVHLCIADLITAFLHVLPQIFWELDHRFRGGIFMCKLIKYLQLIGPYSSSYVLVVTAIDRFIAICYPLKLSWTSGRSRCMLGFAWGTSFLFALPQIFIFSIREVQTGSEVYDCWAQFSELWGFNWSKAYVAWYGLAVFIVPLIILIFTYTGICRAIWVNVYLKNASQLRETRRTVDHDDMSMTQGEGETEMIQISPEEKHKLRKKVNSNGKSHTPNELSLPLAQQSKNHKKTGSQGSFLSESDDEEEVGQSGIEMKPISHPKTSPPKKNMVKIAANGINFKISDPEDKNGVKCKFIDEDEPTVHDTKGEILIKTPSPPRRNSPGLSPKTPTPSSTRRNIHFGSILKKQGGGGRKSLDMGNLQPRTHSGNISRAKIKTVKLTITVILCYILCSTPFILAQLWSTFDPNAQESPFYSGVVFTIVTLLASLNSMVNPWIFLIFNPNLLQNFLRCFHSLRGGWGRSRNGGDDRIIIGRRSTMDTKHSMALNH